MSSPSFYQIRQCENAACGLRYPLTEGHPFGERCPLCLGATRMELQRDLNADVGFVPTQPSPTSPLLPYRAHVLKGEGGKLEALLDNVRSAWNVGAIFRTADAFGVSHIHLCGITPTPENASVCKTALGADKTIPWTAARNALVAAQALKAQGCRLWALEQDERAVSTTDFFTDARIRTDLSQIVLIVGNEVTGVDPALLDLCDKILYIPMHGGKRSLNVEVAFGVMAYVLQNNLFGSG